MDANIPRALGAEQMHGVGDHDGAFVEMMFVSAVQLADTVRRRLQRRHEILEIQASLPRPVSRRPARRH